MPIYYTFVAPIPTSSYSLLSNKPQPLGSNDVKRRLWRNIKALQGIAPVDSGVQPGMVCQYQAIAEFNLSANGDDMSRQLVQKTTAVVTQLALPVFQTLAECELAIEKLTACVKKSLKNKCFLPIVIEINDDSSLVKSSSFQHPVAQIRSTTDKETKFIYEVAAVQLVALAPKIIQDCFLIDPRKLNADGDDNSTRSYQILSFKTKHTHFIAWKSPAYFDNKDQPEAYEFLWDYENSVKYYAGQKAAPTELLADKVARIFCNYTNPIAQQFGLKPRFGTWGIWLEQCATLHTKRSHSELAAQIVRDLSVPDRTKWYAENIIAYLIGLIKDAEKKTTFDSTGSFISRVNFIMTQFTQGTVTEYTKIALESYYAKLSYHSVTAMPSNSSQL